MVPTIVLSSASDYFGVLRWSLLALNCGLILAFMGVMRRATEQLDCQIVREKKFGKEKTGIDRNVLFVIAHPDDEAMFFVPTVLSLKGYSGYKLHLLCLSSGNVSSFLFHFSISTTLAALLTN